MAYHVLSSFWKDPAQFLVITSVYIVKHFILLIMFYININILIFVAVLFDAMHKPLICLQSAWLIWCVNNKTNTKFTKCCYEVLPLPVSQPGHKVFIHTWQLITTHLLHVQPLFWSRGTVPTLLVGQHMMTRQLLCLLTCSLLSYSRNTDSIHVRQGLQVTQYAIGCFESVLCIWLQCCHHFSLGM